MGRPVGGQPLHSLSAMGLMLKTLEREVASEKQGRDLVDTCWEFLNDGRRHQVTSVTKSEKSNREDLEGIIWNSQCG